MVSAFLIELTILHIRRPPSPTVTVILRSPSQKGSFDSLQHLPLSTGRGFLSLMDPPPSFLTLSFSSPFSLPWMGFFRWNTTSDFPSPLSFPSLSLPSLIRAKHFCLVIFDLDFSPILFSDSPFLPGRHDEDSFKFVSRTSFPSSLLSNRTLPSSPPFMYTMAAFATILFVCSLPFLAKRRPRRGLIWRYEAHVFPPLSYLPPAPNETRTTCFFRAVFNFQSDLSSDVPPMPDFGLDCAAPD